MHTYYERMRCTVTWTSIFYKKNLLDIYIYMCTFFENNFQDEFIDMIFIFPNSTIKSCSRFIIPIFDSKTSSIYNTK